MMLHNRKSSVPSHLSNNYQRGRQGASQGDQSKGRSKAKRLPMRRKAQVLIMQNISPEESCGSLGLRRCPESLREVAGDGGGERRHSSQPRQLSHVHFSDHGLQFSDHEGG